MHPLEDPDDIGDHWDTISLDPVSKLLVSLVPGSRTQHPIEQAVADANARLDLDYGLPAIFTDGESAYKGAILKAFGHRYPVARSHRVGRPPGPIPGVPQALLYTQIIKHRIGRKVVCVEIRPIFGKGKLDQTVASLGWNKANISLSQTSCFRPSQAVKQRIPGRFQQPPKA